MDQQNKQWKISSTTIKYLFDILRKTSVGRCEPMRKMSTRDRNNGPVVAWLTGLQGYYDISALTVDSWRLHTREEMAWLTMAAAHLLGGQPIDCRVLSNFSMQVKCTISLPRTADCRHRSALPVSYIHGADLWYMMRRYYQQMPHTQLPNSPPAHFYRSVIHVGGIPHSSLTNCIFNLSKNLTFLAEYAFSSSWK